MTAKPILTQDLQYSHQLWANELKFCEEELHIFDSRLAQIVGQYQGDKIAMKKIERFQNQFIRGQEVLDGLKHENRRHVRYLNSLSKEKTFTSEHRHLTDYELLEEKVDRFKELYDELKRDFNAFMHQN